MSNTPFNLAGPATGWISGFPFHASAWTGIPATGGTSRCFSALNSPGELASAGTSPAWSFNLDLTPAFTNPSCHLLCNGFVMLPSAERSVPPIACIMPEDGLLVGCAPADVTPVLFSSFGEVEQSEAQHLFRDDQQQTLLRWTRQEAHTRFCLITASVDEADLQQRAEAALELDAYALMDREESLRASFYTAFPSAADHAQNALAIECLAGRLRQPTGSISQRWMAASLLTDDVTLEDWYPAFLTWLDLDDQVALDLFASLLEHQDAQGVLMWYQPEADGSPSLRPWLFLGKGLQHLHLRETDPGRVEKLLEPVVRHLSAYVRYADPKRQGRPTWVDMDDAIVPELWDEGLQPVDLCSLLLADIEAVKQTADSLGFISPALAELIDYRDALRSHLLTDLWNSEKECFQSQLASGAAVGRAALGDLLPISWSGLPELHRQSLARSIRRKTGSTRQGLPADWESWDQDDAPAPVHPGHLTLLVEALDHPATAEELQQLIFHLRERAIALYDNNAILPEEWSIHPEEEKDSEKPAARRMLDAGASALLLNLHTRLQRQDQVYANLPKAVRWIDQHRLSFTLTMTLLMTLPILGIVLYFNMKPSLTVNHSYALSGLAQHMHRTGDNDRAINMFEELIQVTTQKGLVSNYKLQLANAHYGNGNYEKASEIYREVLDTSETPVPMAQWNLAQAHIRLGNYDQAIEEIDLFVEHFGSSFPALSDRAQHAKELIASQQVLKKNKPSRQKG